MRAWQVEEHGSPIRQREIARPEPAPGEVLVRIAACGLNFADLLMISGQYQERPTLPFTLGMEVSGTIAGLGTDVTDLAVGDRVVVMAGIGGLAEWGCFKATHCFPIPDDMSLTVAAGFLFAYGTAHLALVHRARLQASETLLVTGAAGGVGLTAVELGKAVGARVIASARGSDRLAVAQAAGADHLVDSAKDDLRQAVKALGGADVVFDPVGGAGFMAALRATNPEGRLIPIGFAGGTVPQIPANLLLVKNLSVLGVYWGGYMTFGRKVLAAGVADLLAMIADGRLKPQVNHVMPFDQATAGLELLRSRRSTGKVVVTID